MFARHARGPHCGNVPLAIHHPGKGSLPLYPLPLFVPAHCAQAVYDVWQRTIPFLFYLNRSSSEFSRARRPVAGPGAPGHSSSWQKTIPSLLSIQRTQQSAKQHFRGHWRPRIVAKGSKQTESIANLSNPWGAWGGWQSERVKESNIARQREWKRSRNNEGRGMGARSRWGGDRLSMR